VKYVKWIAVLLGAMIALAICILFVLGHMPNADRYQTSLEIDAPPAKVWAFLDNEQNMTKWVSWLQDVKRSGPQGPGSVLTLTMKDENNGGMIMRLESRCTEYVPGVRLSEAIGGPAEQFDGTVSYRLTDLGNGKTRLETDSRFHFAQWFANLMSPLILPAARTKAVGDLGRFKALVEKS
jgi:uncharacterized protein YndB with AHSA1/START domain